MTVEIAYGLTTYVVLLFSLSVHESAHAWTALKMGDYTAESEGRITLNPLAHIDPVGTVLFPLLQIFGGVLLFGWARPVPVNPRAFSDMKKGEILVSGAGPASNLLLALLATGILFVAGRVGLSGSSGEALLMILVLGIQLNVMLAVFNLLPLPPLDGSHIARWTLSPELSRKYEQYIAPYGPLILLALLFTGALRWLTGPVRELVVNFLFYLAS